MARRGATPTPSAFDILTRDRRLSAADKRTIKKAAEAEIDAFLVGAGIKNPSKLADKHGGRYLPFEHTPAYVCVEELEGSLYLRVEARVMDLPAQHEAAARLMTDMLEINGDVAGVCRLAIDDGLVIAAGAENLRVLRSPDQITQHVEAVVEFAEAAAKDLRSLAGRRAKRVRRRR